MLFLWTFCCNNRIELTSVDSTERTMVGDVDLANKYLMNIPRYTQNALSVTVHCTLQRQYTEKIFPVMNLRGLSPNSYIHVSVTDLTDLYISTICLPILLQENRWTDRGNIEIANRYMNVEIGTVAFSGNT
jgi:hypothetical protein